MSHHNNVDKVSFSLYATTMKLRKVTEDVFGRVFYTTRVSSLSEFATPFPAEYYVSLVWNNAPISAVKAEELGRQLILSGCRYIVTAGETGNTLETSFDRAYLHLGQERKVSEQDFVMTASLQNENMQGTIEFFAHMTNFDNHEFTKFLIVFLDIHKKARVEVIRIMKRSVILF